jgi:hypothetical protein
MHTKIFTIPKKRYFILLGLIFAIVLITTSAKTHAQTSWESYTTGDLVTSSDDDGSYEKSLTTTFPDGINFGGTNYNNLYVGTNGYITFGQGNSSFSPEGIEGWGDSHSYPIIAAQYDDIDVGNGGNIYYDQYSDYLVITFENIAPYSTPVLYSDNDDLDNPDGNDLQIVLRKPADYSSSNKDFIIEIRYVDISWHVAAINSGNNATAGWSVGGTDGAWKETSYSNTDNFHYHEDNSNDFSSSLGVYAWDVEGGVVQSAPTVDQTTAPDNISYNSAESGGNIASDGGASITESGVVWSTSTTPTYSDNYSADGGASTGSFSSSITGLDPNTTYYIRAYAENSVGTGYGPEKSFTTSKKELTIDGSFTANNKTYDNSTDATIASNNLSLSGVLNGYEDVALTSVVASFASSSVADGITVNISSANITGTDADNYTLSLSGAPTTTANITKKSLTVTADDKSRDYGEANPGFTITYSGFVGAEDESVLGTNPSSNCEATESSLAGNYDITVSGGSDNNYSFNYATGTLTVEAIAPTVTTKEISDIRTTTANGGGDVTSHGGENTTVRGICWSTSTSPTTSDNCTTDGTGTGQFSSNITGLLSDTTYYVRAYATNSVDTIYGGEKSFTTNANAVPDDPSNPFPATGADDISSNTTLSVLVSDPDGDNMDVSFYNASSDSVIGTDVGVADGETASINWSALDKGADYAWYAVANDGSDSATSSSWSFTIKSGGGGGLHPSWTQPPAEPEQGFSVSISQGNTTDSREVDLVLEGGSDTTRMAISRTLEFDTNTNTGQIDYQQEYQWDLCYRQDQCSKGSHTVYVKFYTEHGYSSRVLSDTINLTEEKKKTEKQEKPEIKNGDLISTADSYSIWIVKRVGNKKYRRLILNPEIFNSYGYLKWDAIKEVSRQTLETFTISNLVQEINPDGSIADTKVYTVTSERGADKGTKHHLNINAKQFENIGLSWNSIYHINSTEASDDFYSGGDPLTMDDDVVGWTHRKPQ